MNFNDDGGTSSESDAEAANELESFLYSQLHYKENPDTPDLSTDVGQTSATLCPQYSKQYIEEKPTGSKPRNQDKRVRSSQPCIEKKPNGSINTKQEPASSNQRRPRSSLLVANPMYESSDSDSSEDDGILVLSDAGKNEPITISSDEDTALARAASIRTAKASSTSEGEDKWNFKSRKRKQRSFYVAEYGSDYEDNFLLEESCESDGSDSSVQILRNENLTLNISKSSLLRPRVSELEGVAHGITEDDAESVDLNTPVKWNADMSKYYSSYNKQMLSVHIDDLHAEGIVCTWRLDRDDLVKGGRMKSRYFSSKGRCNNCNEIGHFAWECREPVKPARCPMCGVPGHKETRCPENCCLRCGQPGLGFQSSCGHCRSLQSLQCKECGYDGHLKRDCPDLWRRFHDTTEGGDLADPRSHKLNHLVWCCNCGRRGHVIEECRRYLYSEYPVTPTRVVRYARIQSFLGDQPEDGEERRGKRFKGAEWKEKQRMSSTCPNSRSSSPSASASSSIAAKSRKVRSEPSTPVNWLQSIQQTDLRQVLNNLSGKEKFNLMRKKRKFDRKKEVEPQRRWAYNSSSFEQRVEQGRSKKDKKRQKFYRSQLQEEKQHWSHAKKLIKQDKRLGVSYLQGQDNNSNSQKRPRKKNKNINFPAARKIIN